LSGFLLGNTGNDGAVEATGAIGPPGIQGVAGAAGTNGVDGIDGAVETTGAAGTNGVDGANGAIGSGSIQALNNPQLTCINLDDAAWSTSNWTVANGNIDPQHYFSNNCSGTAIQEHTTNKELLRTIDVLGRETKSQPFFYIYDDGTVEKRITIE
jgi:hypothetical protein